MGTARHRLEEVVRSGLTGCTSPGKDTSEEAPVGSSRRHLKVGCASEVASQRSGFVAICDGGKRRPSMSHGFEPSSAEDWISLSNAR